MASYATAPYLSIYHAWRGAKEDPIRADNLQQTVRCPVKYVTLNLPATQCHSATHSPAPSHRAETPQPIAARHSHTTPPSLALLPSRYRSARGGGVGAGRGGVVWQCWLSYSMGQGDTDTFYTGITLLITGRSRVKGQWRLFLLLICSSISVLCVRSRFYRPDYCTLQSCSISTLIKKVW